MTNTDRVLAYLRSIAPNEASNDQIVKATGVRPHQQVFQITQRLLSQGTIEGSRVGGIWRFMARASLQGRSSDEAIGGGQEEPGVGGAESTVGRAIAARAFEQLAQKIMSEHYNTTLIARRLAGVPKIFDLVSEDGKIVGDAKFLTLVGGERLPPAKFSVIAEHVWLLEKTRAPEKVLVFGNDRQVPLAWLKRYQELIGRVKFYFLDQDGRLECLTKPTCGADPPQNERNDTFERAFHQEMERIYAAALNECGYRATRFLQTVHQKGGLAAAKDLLHKAGISEGLTALWECGRLDLSMEALVLRDPWATLFTEEERNTARTRLRQLGGEA